MSDAFAFVGIGALIGLAGFIGMLMGAWKKGFLLLILGVIVIAVAWPSVSAEMDKNRLATERQQAEIEKINAETGKIQAETREIDKDVEIKDEGLKWMKSFRYGMTLTTLMDLAPLLCGGIVLLLGGVFVASRMRG